jgi:hypothetical protein
MKHCFGLRDPDVPLYPVELQYKPQGAALVPEEQSEEDVGLQ